jgi:hypothetical protein
LAPSPIANVIQCGLCFYIILTTSAFYLGDILQAITAVDEVANFKNYLLSLSLDIILKSDSPDTIVADFLNPSEFIYSFLDSAIYYKQSVLVAPSITYSSILSFSN